MRREPSQERARQTIDSVLRAAGREIEEGGLDRLTTKRIAATAGLSVGAVYEYFPNKEAIVAALMSRWMDAVFEAIDSARPRGDGGADLFTYMNVVLDRVIALHEGQPGLGALFGMLTAMPALREIDRQHDDRVSQSIASALAHFVPHADRAEVAAASCAIPLICHAILAETIVYQVGDRVRMLNNLRVCVMAILSRLAMPL